MDRKITDKKEAAVKVPCGEYLPPRQNLNGTALSEIPENGEYIQPETRETERAAINVTERAKAMLREGCSAKETLEMLRNAGHPPAAEPLKKEVPAAEPDKKAAASQKQKAKFELLGEIADEIASGLPQEIYSKLSGGIVLTEATKLHEKSNALRPLYILGEYINSPRLGRHIALYGGSILKVYGYMSRSALKKELERIIKHELTHHWESLSGVRDLEIYDAVRLEGYRQDIERLSDKNKKQ